VAAAALAVLAVLAVLALAVVAGAGPWTTTIAAPAGASSAPRAATPGDAAVMALVGQSPSVAAGSSFELAVRVAPSAGAATLQVFGWQRLTTRTFFNDALAGRMRGNPVYSTEALPVAGLPADANGALHVAIPIDSNPSAAGIPEFTARADSGGVYPLQVRAYDAAGAALGAPLTTFLVLAAQGSSLPRLSVALVVAVHEPVPLGPDHQPTTLPASGSQAMAGLSSALGRRGGVPLTLDATPQTLDSLASGPSSDRATVAALSQVVAAGDVQVPSSTYVPLALGAMQGAGLDRDVAAQFAAGGSALAADLHHPGDSSAWVSSSQPDAAAFGVLAARGVSGLVVPDRYLSAPPPAYRQSTFARPTELSGHGGVPLAAAGGRPVRVIGADDGLDQHFVNGGDQVLAANHFLAELSMIQLETPGATRGVAVLVPPQWRPDAAFLTTVLAGMAQVPLLSPVTLSGLFDTVPLAQSGRLPAVRSLADAHPQGPDQATLEAWRTARQQLSGLQGIVPGGGPLVARLSRQLLISESADLSAAARRGVLSTITGPIRDIEQRITLPGAVSITLTARKGNVPLTVLSDPGLDAQVRLRLTSQKLTFRPIAGPWGNCATAGSTSLVCHLNLIGRSTTIQVPVETRTSGVFALVAVVLSPDGSLTLATNRDTVRSTAFSGVGVILIVAAGLSLAVWWFRNARHGRRARQLVAPPELDEDGMPLLVPSRPSLGAPVGEKAPEMSPFDRRGGPN